MRIHRIGRMKADRSGIGKLSLAMIETEPGVRSQNNDICSPN